ncbi:MAG: Sua5/YciO/YrdC/YwlC family protein [Malacoplasma sp.]|nr:Sua5/YciO/YrdC/YwlC family protein [Malacoplasma sp.]
MDPQNKNGFYKVYKKDLSFVDIIARELKNNKALIVNTDTVAGILSLNKDLIYQIKARDLNKKLIKFVCDINQINNANALFKNLAKAFWPGKLTLVFQQESYRMPNDLFILELVKKTGPLYSSSANISGLDPIQNINDAIKYFSDFEKEIIFIDSDYTNSGIASTIFDIDNQKTLRKGEIKDEQLQQFCGK